ncbi:MAG: lactonase family protein [Burkholderiales bacterium]
MDRTGGRPTFAYVGCFTTEKRKARGKGVAAFHIDPASGKWRQVDACDALPNPGFIALDRTQRFLYSAHGDSSETVAYARDPQTGKLTFLNKQDTAGNNSSTVVVDAANRYVVVSTGPGVAVFPRNADGSLAPRSDLALPHGEPGPWKRHQEHAHPHQAIFDPSGRFVVAPDKGVDCVHVFRFDAERGTLTPNDPECIKARAGAGPRHLSFHPTKPYAYLVNELASTVTAHRWDSDRGVFTPFQIVPTIPDTYTGPNTGAEIEVAPSGRFLYVSNRGHDSIGACSIDETTGMIAALAWESTRGRKPRFLCLEPGGRRLYAANEDGHTIVEFNVDLETGTLVATGQVIETGSPACIVFAQ